MQKCPHLGFLVCKDLLESIHDYDTNEKEEEGVDECCW
jgi:hypothetical protein